MRRAEVGDQGCRRRGAAQPRSETDRNDIPAVREQLPQQTVLGFALLSVSDCRGSSNGLDTCEWFSVQLGSPAVTLVVTVHVCMGTTLPRT